MPSTCSDCTWHWRNTRRLPAQPSSSPGRSRMPVGLARSSFSLAVGLVWDWFILFLDHWPCVRLIHLFPCETDSSFFLGHQPCVKTNSSFSLALCETDSSFLFAIGLVWDDSPFSLATDPAWDWFIFFLGHWLCVRLIHLFPWPLALCEMIHPFYLDNHKISPILYRLCKKALNKMEEEQKAFWCKCMLFLDKYLFLCCAIHTSQIPPRRH